MTRHVERCGFVGQPISRIFPEDLQLVHGVSSGSKAGIPVFNGAHDGSNDAYWTLRVAINHCQSRVEAINRVRPTDDQVRLQDWTKRDQTLLHRFRLVAVDFEADVHGRVRQVGIATLDSDQIASNAGGVVPVADWKDDIRVRSLSVLGRNKAKHIHPSARPNCGPLFAHIGNETMTEEEIVDEGRRVLTPSSEEAFEPFQATEQ